MKSDHSDQSIVIFINPDAIDTGDLFLNEKWSLQELYDNIYTISVNDTRLDWLVKTYKKSKYTRTESMNLRKLNSISGIPKLLASHISPTINYNIISKVPGLDLFEYTRKYGPFKENQIREIAKSMLVTIDQIHKHQIVHKDIKPENIVYDPDSKQVTFIDFEGKYTVDYCSPEQVYGKKITSQTDLWSIGVTLYYILHGRNLFNGIVEVLKKEVTFPSHWSESLKDFLGCLIHRDSKLRYNAKEALKHVWFYLE